MFGSKQHSSRSSLGLVVIAAAFVAGCGNAPEPGNNGKYVDTLPIFEQPPPVNPPDMPPTDNPPPSSLTCQPNIVVDPNSRALIVTDPEVLARFSLERVLQQLIDRSGMPNTPLQLMQELFDTQNSIGTGVFPGVTHCDDPTNIAFRSAPAAFCPRAEGKLATSTGFFQEGHPDSFVPVALVNRFDLTPAAGSNCGEHRIMFAKLSGQTNPNERVFLAFEGVIDNVVSSDTLVGCRPIAALWASLATETNLQVIGDRMEALYFNGYAGFSPVVSPEHYSSSLFGGEDDGGGYGDKTGHPRHGQLRVSEGMQEPWEFREFHIGFGSVPNPEPVFAFQPVTTKNNPRAELFDPSVINSDSEGFRAQLLQELPTLAAKETFGIQFAPQNSRWNAGASMITSNPAADFTSRAFDGEAGQTFWTQIQTAINEQNLDRDCPPDDPLYPEHLMQRVSMLSCAGCHAPEQYLGSSRSLGCGQTWPLVSQRAHIDERGQLSPAMTDNFLPRRAEILSMYLQACDIPAIQASLQPAERFASDTLP
ncbi:MAG TPA: hypothetical protein PK156_33265 [Polyangium sp.]|nr:hypothetical protein [Polyangium sp.]